MTPKTRSEIMASIRSRDTGIELAMRKILRGLRLRYHPAGIPGNPDFASKKRRLAVFVDGCFWHGCPVHFRPPKSNARFWRDKIIANKRRDRKTNRLLRGAGWKVLRIWEHELGGQKGHAYLRGA